MRESTWGWQKDRLLSGACDGRAPRRHLPRCPACLALVRMEEPLSGQQMVTEQWKVMARSTEDSTREEE